MAPKASKSGGQRGRPRNQLVEDSPAQPSPVQPFLRAYFPEGLLDEGKAQVAAWAPNAAEEAALEGAVAAHAQGVGGPSFISEARSRFLMMASMAAKHSAAQQAEAVEAARLATLSAAAIRAMGGAAGLAAHRNAIATATASLSDARAAAAMSLAALVSFMQPVDKQPHTGNTRRAGEEAREPIDLSADTGATRADGVAQQLPAAYAASLAALTSGPGSWTRVQGGMDALPVAPGRTQPSVVASAHGVGLASPAAAAAMIGTAQPLLPMAAVTPVAAAPAPLLGPGPGTSTKSLEEVLRSINETPRHLTAWMHLNDPDAAAPPSGLAIMEQIFNRKSVSSIETGSVKLNNLFSALEDEGAVKLSGIASLTTFLEAWTEVLATVHNTVSKLTAALATGQLGPDDRIRTLMLITKLNVEHTQSAQQRTQFQQIWNNVYATAPATTFKTWKEAYVSQLRMSGLAALNPVAMLMQFVIITPPAPQGKRAAAAPYGGQVNGSDEDGGGAADHQNKRRRGNRGRGGNGGNGGAYGGGGNGGNGGGGGRGGGGARGGGPNKPAQHGNAGGGAGGGERGHASN